MGGGALTVLLGRFGGRTLEFVLQVILARGLGPGGFGVYALGRILIRALGFAAALGLHNGVVRFGAPQWATHPGRSRSLARKALALTATVGAVAAAGLFLSAGWWATSIFEMPELRGVLRVMSVAVLLMSVRIVAAAATRVSLEMKDSVLSEDLAQPAANLALVGLVLALGGGLLGVSAAFTLAVGGSCLLALFFLSRLLPRERATVDGEEVSSGALLRFSLPTALAGTLGIYVVWVDRLCLGYFRSPEEVGVYQGVAQLAAILTVILTAFSAIVGPLVARLHALGRRSELQEVFQMGTKWGLYCGVPVYMTMLFCGRELIVALFGPEYLSGVVSLGILATGQIVNLGTGAVGIALIMTGNHKRWLAITLLSLLVNAVASILLVPRLGAVGAAISTTVAVFTMNGAGILAARVDPGIWAYNRRYLKGLAAALIAAASTQLLVSVLEPSGVSRIVLVILAASTVFAAALAAMGFDDEDRDLARVFWDRLGALPRGGR